MAEKFNGLQILVFPIFVGNPFTVISSVVQIQHGGNGINAESVYMIKIDPVKGVRDQKVFYFIFCVIEYLGAPVRMFSLSRISIFIKRFAVKIGQSVGILREMGGNPVENHADALFMHVVDKIHEILWASVAGCGSVIAGHLISP